MGTYDFFLNYMCLAHHYRLLDWQNYPVKNTTKLKTIDYNDSKLSRSAIANANGTKWKLLHHLKFTWELEKCVGKKCDECNINSQSQMTTIFELLYLLNKFHSNLNAVLHHFSLQFLSWKWIALVAQAIVLFRSFDICEPN